MIAACISNEKVFMKELAKIADSAYGKGIAYDQPIEWYKLVILQFATVEPDNAVIASLYTLRDADVETMQAVNTWYEKDKGTLSPESLDNRYYALPRSSVLEHGNLETVLSRDNVKIDWNAWEQYYKTHINIIYPAMMLVSVLKKSMPNIDKTMFQLCS